MKHKTYIAVLLAGMLALAGCGGGGNGVAEPPATVTAAQTAIKAATDAVAKLTATSDEDAVDAADGLIEDAEEAIGKAPESERDRLNAMLDAAEQAIQGQKTRLAALQEKDNEIKKLQGQLDDEKKRVTDLEGDLDDEKDKVTELAEDLEKAEGRDAETMAMRLHAAIRASSGSISFDGTKVTNGSTELAKTADSILANNGWTGGHFAKDKQEARVYWRANKKEEGIKFSGITDDGIYESILSGAPAGTAPAPFVLSLNKDEQSDLIVINGVEGTSGTVTPKFDANGAIGGTFHGVSGLYVCTEGTCTVSKHADNKRSLRGTGTWSFRTTNRDTRVTDPKNVYAYYGWWLNTGGTENTYQVNAFAGTTGTAAGLADARSFSEVDSATGTATYEGGAAGKYAIYSSVPKAHESGHFTANAKLTADFDASINTLKGTIDKFMVDGKEKADWSITLKAENAGGELVIANFDALGAVAEWKIGNADPESGTWGNVHFHDVGEDLVPNHVTGQFDITNAAAEIIGAFGATK